MESKNRLIDADAFLSSMIKRFHCVPLIGINDYDCESLKQMLNEAPTVGAVPVEKYNELREAFVDYVCSGVHNPAPHCKNRIDGDCVDERGWCTYRHCRGFNPDGERKDGDGNG